MHVSYLMASLEDSCRHDRILCGPDLTQAMQEGCLHRRYCLTPHSAPRYSVFTDKEAQQAQVHVSFKQAAAPCATPRHYKRALTEDIFQTALNKRFFRISRQQDPPFYAAEVSHSPSSLAGESPLQIALQHQSSWPSPWEPSCAEAKEQVLCEAFSISRQHDPTPLSTPQRCRAASSLLPKVSSSRTALWCQSSRPSTQDISCAWPGEQVLCGTCTQRMC